MKELIIGDIHGSYLELLELISKVPKDTRIILVGDLIDRGKYSKKAVQYCIDNSIEVCLGNHELMCIETENYIKPINKYKLNTSLWFVNGGAKVYDSYKDKKELLQHIQYFKTLPIYIELHNKINNKPVIVSHTYILDLIDFNKELIEDDKYNLVWSRKKPKQDKDMINIHGHSPTDWYSDLIHEPYISDTSINLDTGCAYNTKSRGYLTGLLLPDYKFIQIKRKD